MIKTQEITCISCPVGCRIQVTLEDGHVIKVENNACKRGEIYARQECVRPLRMVTAVARVHGSTKPVSVKTQEPIPKEKIKDCMDIINSLKLNPPILMGQVLVENIADTGINLIATRTIA